MKRKKWKNQCPVKQSALYIETHYGVIYYKHIYAFYIMKQHPLIFSPAILLNSNARNNSFICDFNYFNARRHFIRDPVMALYC